MIELIKKSRVAVPLAAFATVAILVAHREVLEQLIGVFMGAGLLLAIELSVESLVRKIRKK